MGPEQLNLRSCSSSGSDKLKTDAWDLSRVMCTGTAAAGQRLQRSPGSGCGPRAAELKLLLKLRQTCLPETLAVVQAQQQLDELGDSAFSAALAAAVGSEQRADSLPEPCVHLTPDTFVNRHTEQAARLAAGASVDVAVAVARQVPLTHLSASGEHLM